MSATGIRAGKAFVEIGTNNNPLMRGLAQAQKRLAGFGSAVGQIGSRITMAGAKFGAALAFPMGGAIRAASNFEELKNKFGAVFGALAEQAEAWAASTSKSVARSKGDLMNAMSMYQAFAVGLGFTGDKAMEMSKQLTSLAVDLASFHNLTDEEAFGRFISAMSGSSEVLDQFGINIKAAAIEEELLAQGINKSTAQATEQEKALARLAIITRAMGSQGAIGDAAKTSGSFANRMKALKAQVTDAAVSFGSALLPMVTRAADALSNLLRQGGEWLARNQQLIGGYVEVAVKGVAITLAVGLSFMALGKAAGVLATALGIVSTVFKLLFVVMGALFTPIGLIIAGLGALAAYFAYASGMGGKALDWLGGKFGQLKQDGIAAWEGIADALASGDIGQAAKILWLTLRKWWQQGIAWLMPYWLEFKRWFVEVGAGAFYGLKAAWEIVGDGLSVAWIELVAGLQSAWSSFTAFCSKTWDNISTWFANRWADLRALVDKDFDKNKAKAYNEEQSRQNHAFINANKATELGSIERERKKQREAQEKEHNATMAKIGTEYNNALAQNASENEAKIKAAEKELADATKDWKEAIKVARDNRAAKEAKDKGPDKMQAMAAPNAVLQKQLSMLDGLAASEKKTVGVRGTFNSAEVWGLGAGNAADRLVAAGEKTADNTKKILDQMKQNGMEFQ